MRGPILLDNLRPFCLAATVTIEETPQLNLSAATCKLCGIPLPQRAGTAAYLHVGGRHRKPIYVCHGCRDAVLDAHDHIEGIKASRRGDG